MEMFRDSFACCILLNGKVVKEEGNVCILPFESEYVIRLRNKARKRALADVHIDGRLAVKGMIVNENSTVDLERFVIDNLNEGARFKLVRKNDNRVEQQEELENGCVEVRFYPEKDRPEVKIVEHNYKHYCHHHYGHCRTCCNDWNCPVCYPGRNWPWHHPWHDDVWCGGLSSSGGTVYGASSDTLGKGMSAGGGSTLSCNSMSMGDAQVNNSLSAGQGEDAATVEGSKSYQRFVAGYIDADMDHPIVLQIKLHGVSKIIDQCPCGHKRNSDERYCPKCGNALAVGVAA